MKTLEQIKKEKNYKAHIKGYPIDPEGFPLEWLGHRFRQELQELKKADFNYKSTVQIMGRLAKDGDPMAQNTIELAKLGFLDELGDLSNIIDYIATKIIVDYPDIHDPKEMKG